MYTLVENIEQPSSIAQKNMQGIRPKVHLFTSQPGPGTAREMNSFFVMQSFSPVICLGFEVPWDQGAGLAGSNLC